MPRKIPSALAPPTSPVIKAVPTSARKRTSTLTRLRRSRRKMTESTITSAGSLVELAEHMNPAYALLSLKESIARHKARSQQREAAQTPVKGLEPLAEERNMSLEPPGFHCCLCDHTKQKPV